MPPKNKRLTRTQFLGAFTEGRRTHGPLFDLIVTPSIELSYAVVVSKKVVPRAVLRNRIRRRVYHALKDAFRETPRQGKHIFIMKAASKDTLPLALTEAITKALTLAHRNKKHAR